MNIHKIIAVSKKQIKETFKNKEVFIQFVMFPVLAVVMQNTIKIDGMPDNFFVILFATMYIGMSPLTSMAAIISEEKDKNTLRILMMSNVKPVEYLLGIGFWLFLICMAGAFVFGMTGNFTNSAFVEFMMIMAVGIITSLLIGAAIGTVSRNQMAATSITVPVMLVFSFIPMISMFNDKVKLASRITYSQQIHNMMYDLGSGKIELENIVVIGLNILCALAIFYVAYKKCGLAGND